MHHFERTCLLTMLNIAISPLKTCPCLHCLLGCVVIHRITVH